MREYHKFNQHLFQSKESLKTIAQDEIIYSRILEKMRICEIHSFIEWGFDHEVRLKFVYVRGTKWLLFSVKYLFDEAHESRLEIFIAWERLNMIFFSLVSDS